MIFPRIALAVFLLIVVFGLGCYQSERNCNVIADLDETLARTARARTNELRLWVALASMPPGTIRAQDVPAGRVPTSVPYTAGELFQDQLRDLEKEAEENRTHAIATIRNDLEASNVLVTVVSSLLLLVAAAGPCEFTRWLRSRPWA